MLVWLQANAAGDDKAIAAAEAKVECARDSLAKEEQEADMAARVAAETEEASLAAQAEIRTLETEQEETMSDFQKMMAAKMMGL